MIGHESTMYSMHVQHNVPFVINDWPKLAILGSKIRFFGLRQAILRALKAAGCRTARSMDIITTGP